MTTDLYLFTNPPVGATDIVLRVSAPAGSSAAPDTSHHLGGGLYPLGRRLPKPKRAPAVRDGDGYTVPVESHLDAKDLLVASIAVDQMRRAEHARVEERIANIRRAVNRRRHAEDDLVLCDLI